MYTTEVNRLANQRCPKQVSNGAYISTFSQMSLVEYIQACQRFRSDSHAQPCSLCTRKFEVAGTVREAGYYRLSNAFHHVSP